MLVVVVVVVVEDVVVVVGSGVVLGIEVVVESLAVVVVASLPELNGSKSDSEDHLSSESDHLSSNGAPHSVPNVSSDVSSDSLLSSPVKELPNDKSKSF